MNNNNHSYAVILAGGEGNRFWPLSRSLNPKQFLALYNANSIFEDTLLRVKTVILPENTFIITNQLYFPEIFDYTSAFNIPRSNIIFEPEGKNTAPSIAVASRLISLIDPEAVTVILPSDHLIKDRVKFRNLLQYALSLKELAKRRIITFGIPPDYPSTGYGYVKIKSQAESQKSQIGMYQVERFVEKPDIEKAKRFFENRRYFWNSGMFFGYAGAFLDEIREKLPSLYRLVSQISKPDDINSIWKNIKAVSFDYGVLEKSKNLLMVPASNLGWSDLGTWTSLDNILPKDNLSNTIKADTIVLESNNITVFGRDRLIACLGLENLIIVDTPDALLILRKDKGEEVKRIAQILKKNNRQEYYLHKTVKRPWGKYTVLDSGLGFKVKLVEVLPKKALSLQKHLRRSEHWVVVEGKARITKGRKVYFINGNESTFIAKGCVHRLENPADYPLKIVEVQSGDYLGEDDIVRMKDAFERI